MDRVIDTYLAHVSPRVIWAGRLSSFAVDLLA